MDNDYGYGNHRKDYRYYKFLRCILAILSLKSKSILDVGSRGVDYISFLPLEKKVSIDIDIPVNAPGVEPIKGDFLTQRFDMKFDIVCCFQVLEHIDDDSVTTFANKLLDIGEVVVVSVPYMWEKGVCKWHYQDPIDVDKLVSWFGRSPVYIYNVYDDLGRMIAIFINENITNKINELNAGDVCTFMPYNIEGVLRQDRISSLS